MNKEKIIFIGGGNMARAIIDGLIENDFAKDRILVIDPSSEQLEKLIYDYQVITANKLEAIQSNDVIVLSTKPNNILDVCESIKDKIKNQLVISIAAGISIAKISVWLNNHTNIVRSMPNLLAKIKHGVTALSGHKGLDPKLREKTNKILESVGKTIWLDEKKIDAVTALSGSGPAYVFYFLNSLIKAGEKIGLSHKESQFLAQEVLLGSAIMSNSHINELNDLIKKISSTGGTTEAAINSLNKDKVEQHLHSAMYEAFQRSKEIGS